MSSFVKKALANTSWLVFEKILAMSANLVVSMALARSLGPEGFGSLNYLLALVALIAPIAALGLNAIVTRELVNRPEEQDKIIATAVTFRLLGSLSGVLICLVVAFYGWGLTSRNVQLGFLILAIANFFSALNVLEFWFQAHMGANTVAKMRLTVVGTFATAKMLAVFFQADVLVIVSLFAIETLCLGLGFLLIYRLTSGAIRLGKTCFSYGLSLLKQSSWLILSGIATVIYLKIDQVMLESLASTAEVGTYAVAARLSEVWYFFADAVVITLFPALLKLRKDGLWQAYQLKLQQISDILLVMALVLAIGVSLVAKPVILLLFGVEYTASVIILQLHIWAGLFVFMRALVSKWLLTESLLSISLLSHGLGAVINLVANWFLIPLWGGEGAAIATIISYFVASYLAFWISPKTRPIARIMSRSLLLPLTLGYRYWPQLFSKRI